MDNPSRKPNAPTRSVTDVGPGDYVKIGSRFEKITSNTAHGQEHAPKHWTVNTERGSYGMFSINAYAKAEDIEK